MKRRSILKGLTLLPFTGLLSAKAMADPVLNDAPKQRPAEPDLFKELGIRPIINARGTMTYLSGSLMLPEVMAAINATSRDFANMYEVEEKIGAKIAEMLQCEAAMVTSGAAAALTVGTAACITGKNQDLIKLLPNLPGPQREVIMQKSHRYVFDQAVRMNGIKIVEVVGPEEMDKAFNANTVMTLFFNAASDWYGVPDSITREDFVRISKAHSIPSFIDAAADYPPKSNLFRFQKMGFDLVTFSGGKMLRGPQSSGLLLGRRDLIEAAMMNYSPNESPIGRPMKVNKEEIFGMYAALKTVLQRDDDLVWKEWVDQTKKISSIVEKVPSVKGTTVIHNGESNRFPGLTITWDQQKVKITPQQVLKQLSDGTPRIEAMGGKDGLSIAVVTLRPDQIDIVGRRVREILQKAV